METSLLLSSALMGTILSAVFQIIKKYIAPEHRLTVIAGLCVVSAVAYTYLIKSPEVWQSMLAVLSVASTVYAVVIKTYIKSKDAKK